MRTREGRLARIVFGVGCFLLMGLAGVANGAPEEGPALVYPVNRVYPLVAVHR